jgi:hypothetical protein
MGGDNSKLSKRPSKDKVPKDDGAAAADSGKDKGKDRDAGARALCAVSARVTRLCAHSRGGAVAAFLRTAKADFQSKYGAKRVVRGPFVSLCDCVRVLMHLPMAVQPGLDRL